MMRPEFSSYRQRMFFFGLTPLCKPLTAMRPAHVIAYSCDVFCFSQCRIHLCTVSAGHTSIVRKLRSHKADLECRDVRGMSCLVAAFRQGCVSVVEYLVDLVRHFPSDDECSRHLAIVNDEVMAVSNLNAYAFKYVRIKVRIGLLYCT